MSSEKKLSGINFFICSTFEDLKEYRNEVIKVIKSKSGAINSQEFFGARSQKSIETCLEEVGKSNIFIMFLGMRYGSVDKSSGKSFVELEYEEAKKLKLPILVYFLDEEYPIPSKYVDTIHHDKLGIFKQGLQEAFTVDKFTSPENLAGKVIQDLQRDLPKYGFKIDEKELSVGDTKLKSEIIRFRYLPKVSYGKELIVTVKLEDFLIASREECDAFSVTFGATIKRNFSFLDSDLDLELPKNFRNLYASFEMGEELLEIEENKVVKIKVKTIQGVYSWKKPLYEYVDVVPELYSLNMIKSSVIFGPKKERIIVGYEKEDNLICGFKLLEILGSRPS